MKLARLTGDFDAKLERLTGHIEASRTHWQRLTAIIAGQVTLPGRLVAAAFGAVRLFRHG
jgi:hypothetical protein